MSSPKKLIWENIDLKSGSIIYDEFKIDFSISFEKQKWLFDNDMIQIIFGDLLTIDIGWYPSFQQKGYFWLRVIKNYDWDNPIFEKKCKDVFLLKQYLQEAINFADKIFHTKDL